MKKISVCLLGAAVLALSTADASAQSFRQFTPKVRKQYFAVSTDWLNMMPLHLKEAPFEQLTGKELGPNLHLKRDVHQIAGATLSSQSVTRAVRTALALYQVVIRTDAAAVK